MYQIWFYFRLKTAFKATLSLYQIFTKLSNLTFRIFLFLNIALNYYQILPKICKIRTTLQFSFVTNLNISLRIYIF